MTLHTHYETYVHEYCLGHLMTTRNERCPECIENEFNKLCEDYEPISETLIREVEDELLRR